jgi:hypothetical protein
MKIQKSLLIVWLSVLAGVLVFSSPAMAAGDPLIDQARDQLHQALNPGGDPPSDADRITLLKSALKELRESAPVYRGQRAKAIEDIRQALELLQQGDADHKVDDLIRDALDKVRDIT